jgi:hypothetical protein
VLSRKTSECCPFDRLKEVPTTDAQPAHDVIVDALQHLSDRGIGLSEREECLFAKTAENAALGELYAILHLGLVLRASRTCWQDANAIMSSHDPVAAVDLRIVEAGAVDAGLQIVGTISRGTPSKKMNMRTCEPIQSGRVWVHVASAKA